MEDTLFIVSKNEILQSIKFALELNIQDERILNILMHDIENEIETEMVYYCEEYKDGEE